MAKVITQESVDKAVAKATAAEQKRCIAAVKKSAADAIEDNGDATADFKRGAKAGQSAALANIKAE